eukprot:scaffold218424_cov52-Attheya_sp.AAC.2
MGWSECGICKTEYSADTSKDEAPCTEAFDAHKIRASDALCFALAEKYDLLAEKYSLLAGRRTSSSITSNASRGGGDQEGRSHSRDTATTNSSSSSSNNRPGKRAKKEAERVTGSRQRQKVIELHEEEDDEDEEEQEVDSYDRFDTDDVDDALDEDWKNDSEGDASVANTNTNSSTMTTSSVPASAQDLADKLNLPRFVCGKGVDGIASLSDEEEDSMLPTRFQDIFHLMDFLFAPSHPKGTRYELLFMESSLKRGGTKTRKWLRTFKKNNPTHKAVRWHQTKCQTWAPTNKGDLKAFVSLLNGLYQERTGQERPMAQSRPYC